MGYCEISKETFLRVIYLKDESLTGNGHIILRINPCISLINPLISCPHRIF